MSHAADTYADMIEQLNVAARNNTPALILIDKGESSSASGANISMPLLYQAIAHLCHLAVERKGIEELKEVMHELLDEFDAEYAGEARAPTTV